VRIEEKIEAKTCEIEAKSRPKIEAEIEAKETLTISSPSLIPREYGEDS